MKGLTPVLNVIRNCAAFDQLDEAAIEQLAPLFSRKNLTNKAFLPIRRGQNEPYLYLVKSGVLDFNRVDSDESQQVIINIPEYGLAGGFLLYAVHNSGASLSANGEVEVLQILWSDLLGFFNAYPVGLSHFNEVLQQVFYQAQASVFLLLKFQISDPRLFKKIVHGVQWRKLQNGEVLFEQGDNSEEIFLVLTGRLKTRSLSITGMSSSSTVYAGGVVGEVSMLTREPRSATVLAIRDTVVGCFSREGFELVVQHHPHAALYLARLLGKRFNEKHTLDSLSEQHETFLLVSPRYDFEINQFATELTGFMQEWGATTCITSSDIEKALGISDISLLADDRLLSSRCTKWLEVQEKRYKHVILVTDNTWTDWNERALHHSDHLLVISDSSKPNRVNEREEKIHRAGRLAKHLTKTLILIHPTESGDIVGTEQWLAERNFDDWWHVRQGNLKDMQRIARLLTGNANALVLGGGGARGYAHIGVMRALEEQGIPIDKIAGTSIGAIIGSGFCMGYDSSSIAGLCKKHVRKLFDYTLPILSLVKGRVVNRELNRTFGDQRIEDLLIPFFCISTNLTRAEQVVHDRGSLKEALRASMSLPAMIPPVCRNGDLLVDGGLLNNLPIDQMRKMTGRVNIIAVDISPKLDLTNNNDFPPDVSGFKLLLSRLNPFQKSIKTPSLVNVLERSMTIAAVNYSVLLQEKNMADLYLELPVETVATLDYDKVDEISDLGYAASSSKIKAWANRLV
ncbi:hypothetical protein A9Q82_08065 [Cycloclasticus sp. 46_120_T64]|nr:hypothetical protein A9Q82_08065 [Cycloclasticus sp. 46_120_T64]